MSSRKRRSLKKSSVSQKKSRMSKRSKSKRKSVKKEIKIESIPLKTRKIYSINPGYVKTKQVDFINNDKKRWNQAQREVMRWLKEIVYDEDFLESVFDDEIIGRREMKKILQSALGCTKNLIPRIVEEVCLGYINYSKLEMIACASFGIALKLIGCHDWIYDDEVMQQMMIAACGGYQKKYKVCKKALIRMENNILYQTKWQPCKGVF